MSLVAPKSYVDATPEERAAVSNGCGPSSAALDLVPDTVYGLSIAQACKIHDWEYAELDRDTIDDKLKADERFLDNMLRIIDKHTENPVLKWLRRRRAYKYFFVVSRFGGPAFWENKTPAKNLVEKNNG